MMSPWPVVLASASPRRDILLRSLFAEFEVVPAEVDEQALVDADPWVTAQRLAREKALCVFETRPDCLVIGGDTVVALQELCGSWTQLAKPSDRDEAHGMLRRLAGNTHTVITGICLRWPQGMSAFTESTRVAFRQLSDAEIERYLDTGESMDKAGAYGLQGGAKDFVAHMEGSPSNVVGLPVERLQQALVAILKSK